MNVKIVKRVLLNVKRLTFRKFLKKCTKEKKWLMESRFINFIEVGDFYHKKNPKNLASLPFCKRVMPNISRLYM